MLKSLHLFEWIHLNEANVTKTRHSLHSMFFLLFCFQSSTCNSNQAAEKNFGYILSRWYFLLRRIKHTFQIRDKYLSQVLCQSCKARFKKSWLGYWNFIESFYEVLGELKLFQMPGFKPTILNFPILRNQFDYLEQGDSFSINWITWVSRWNRLYLIGTWLLQLGP